MMKDPRGYLLILLVLGLSGCATLMLRSTEPVQKEDDRPSRVYQGTISDLYDFYRIIPLIDLPLSFVADTVLLPVTIREQFYTGELQRAAEAGDTTTVSILLANGTDVDIRDTYGQTALMTSARAGQEKIVEILIEKGADLNAKSKHLEATPLMFAVMNHNEKIANILLDKGADINAKTSEGFTPLMYAAGDGSEELTQTLLTRGADVHVLTDSGVTALYWAAQKGDIKIVELLLENGADPNEGKYTYRTPLMNSGDTILNSRLPSGLARKA